MMRGPDSGTICQPGRGASCALCCGSHNYRAGRDEMDALFRARRRAFPATVPSPLPMVIDDGIQCPYVGFIDEADSIIGCLLYFDESSASGDHRAFMARTCRVFSCMARETLSPDEVRFAAALMGDWLHYGLLINDIALLRDLMRRFALPAHVTGEEREAVRERLSLAAFSPKMC